MKKNFVMGILCLVVSTSAWAQYTLDSTRRMSPGVIYKHYHRASPIRQIHVMEIDLTESTINVQTVKSGGVINAAKETVQTMYAAHDIFRGHDVTAGINCDFFTSQGPQYNPRHMMIGDGEILWDTTLNRTVFGITENRTPFITKLNGSYSVTAGSTNRSINHINRYGGTDQLVLYNRFKGGNTGTAAGGTELRIVPVNGIGGWKANATISCKVLAKSGAGNMALDSGEAVLYGLGTAKTFLDGINVDDVITLNLQVITNPSGLTNIKQLTGGWTRLVLDGANCVTASVADEGGAVATSPEPRTAIGFNQTKDKIYFTVVDGREEGVSEGMTLNEMGALMLYLGCYQALNLDGGGSSTMVGNNGDLRNNPSDSPPRAIPSALLAYLSSITLDDFENGVGPQLTINNDGNWHKYTWNLANLNGTTADTGNGQLESAGVRLDAIEFTQPNTATTWFIFVDDIMVDPNGTAATGVRMAADTAKQAAAVPALKETIMIYPNPSNGVFTIDFKQNEVTTFTLKVLDTYGKKLSERKYQGGTQTINLSHLPKGVYIVYVNAGAINETFKVVIK